MRHARVLSAPPAAAARAPVAAAAAAAAAPAAAAAAAAGAICRQQQADQQEARRADIRTDCHCLWMQLRSSPHLGLLRSRLCIVAGCLLLLYLILPRNRESADNQNDDTEVKYWYGRQQWLAEETTALNSMYGAQIEARVAACDQYAELLQGVDVYVIEMPKRAGQVQNQMDLFRIGSSATAVAAVTPSTVIGPGGVTPQTLATECADRPLGTLPYGPFHVADTAFSTTLSHVKALKQACARPDHKDILVVLEVGHCIQHYSCSMYVDVVLCASRLPSLSLDYNFSICMTEMDHSWWGTQDDARLEPMTFWPAPLAAMVRELPENWKVVNAACSNLGWPAAKEMFRPQTISQEYGAVAVLYNLANPTVCAKVRQQCLDPIDII